MLRIVSLSAAQQATVTAAADLAAAADAALVVAATANNVVQFTYGTDTYLLATGHYLHIKAEVGYVAVLHDVVFAFHS